MTRADCLDTAKQYVCRDRAATHGNMEDNFNQIANYWYLWKGVCFTPLDVAVMMSLLKLARMQSNLTHDDNYIDACGYLACGAEIAAKRKEPIENN